MTLRSTCKHKLEKHLDLVSCGCDTSCIVSVHIQCQATIYTLSLCSGYSWRVRLAKQETLTPPGHLVSPLVCRGPLMSTAVLHCWCHSDNASVLLHFNLEFLRPVKFRRIPLRSCRGKVNNVSLYQSPVRPSFLIDPTKTNLMEYLEHLPPVQFH